jgi:hypothetical protein
MKAKKKLVKQSLEKRIIKQVYRFELKRTSLTIFRYILSVTLLILGVIMLTIAFLQVLAQQQTLAMLELFREDISIIKEQFSDVLATFWFETPKLLMMSIVVLFVLLVFIIFLGIGNWKKLRHRVVAIKKFFNQSRQGN